MNRHIKINIKTKAPQFDPMTIGLIKDDLNAFFKENEILSIETDCTSLEGTFWSDNTITPIVEHIAQELEEAFPKGYELKVIETYAK